MILLDSSFLIAYHNTRDVHHARAASVMEQLMQEYWGPALLIEYVFLEVVTVLVARRGLATASMIGDRLFGARDLEFITCSELFVDAWEIFRTQENSKLSFADAAIVAAAKQCDARFVATFDKGFHGVAGIEVVPT